MEVVNELGLPKVFPQEGIKTSQDVIVKVTEKNSGISKVISVPVTFTPLSDIFKPNFNNETIKVNVGSSITQEQILNKINDQPDNTKLVKGFPEVKIPDNKVPGKTVSEVTFKYIDNSVDIVTVSIEYTNDKNNNAKDDTQEVKEAQKLIDDAIEKRRLVNEEIKNAGVAVSQKDLDKILAKNRDYEAARIEVDRVIAVASKANGGEDLSKVVLERVDIPTVNDDNDNNVNDVIDKLARYSIKAAADKKRQAIQENVRLTFDEKSSATKLVDEAAAAAQAKINEADSDEKVELALSDGITNLNNLFDNLMLDNALKFIKLAEKAAKKASENKTDIEDEAISVALKQELDALIKQADEAKKLADKIVTSLPDTDRKIAFSKRVDDIENVSSLESNDANANGKIDTIEVAAAEKLIQTAKAAQFAFFSAFDNSLFIISRRKKEALEAAKRAYDEAKKVAESAVTSAHGATGAETLDTSALTDVTVPELNDSNDNNKIDTAGDVETVEEAVVIAETAAQAAEEKKRALEGTAVSPSDKAELDRLIAEANSKKAEAEQLFSTLPDSDKEDELFNRVSALLPILSLESSDHDANETVDSEEVAEAEDTSSEAMIPISKPATPSQKTLPKTGDQSNNLLLVGLLTSLFGLLPYKRRKNDKD